MLQCERLSPGETGGEFSVTARREEVGTASGKNADDEKGGMSAVLLQNQRDKLRPISANGRVTPMCCQR